MLCEREKYFCFYFFFRTAMYAGSRFVQKILDGEAFRPAERYDRAPCAEIFKQFSGNNARCPGTIPREHDEPVRSTLRFKYGAPFDKPVNPHHVLKIERLDQFAQPRLRLRVKIDTEFFGARKAVIQELPQSNE
jgi:hypothetical protein